MFPKRFLIATIFLLLLSVLPAQKLGYALSGGGARGLAHVGILKVLEEYNVYPDYISGTSIGSLVGALYATGLPASEVEACLLKLDLDSLLDDSYPRGDIYIGQKRWAPYGNINFEISDTWRTELRTGLFNANLLNLELARIFASAGDIDFASLPIPFTAIATNIVSGEEQQFTSGSLMQAVRASLSVPSIIRAFEIDGNLYVDGGLTNNLPINTVRDLGSDLVIGFKTNSPLRDEGKLGNVIEVLDQSINIGMTRTILAQDTTKVFLIEPDLLGYHTRSFSNAAEIIQLGEDYARERIDQILAFLSDNGYTPIKRPMPKQPSQVYHISKIEIEGNRYLSRPKILDYLRLESGMSYHIDQIVAGCQFLWNSQLFRSAYPILIPDEAGYILKVIVDEKQRNDLSLNISYTNEELLHAGAVLSLNNYILKNSKLLAELKLGTNSELNLDYVKNFGDFWGIYYRVFGYINERTSYLYDDDHFKTDSVKRLEYGVTSGLGFFANRFLSTEGFLYTYKSHQYRDISHFMIPRTFTVSGFGLKAFHESVDDYDFPRSGARIMLKFNFSHDNELSDFLYNKFTGDFEFYRPYSDQLSLVLGLSYGSYFENGIQSQIDPHYIGGSQGYLGYDRYEVSAPFYKIYKLGFSLNPYRRIYTELGAQALNHADYDDWSLNQELEYSLYSSIAYKTVLGPVKASLSIPFDGRPRFYLSLGYCYDIFRYSRK